MSLTNEQYKEIADLASLQWKLEQEIVAKEIELVNLNDKLKTVRETLLPEAMMLVGLQAFTLKSGHSVKVSKFYTGNINPENATAAFAWLRKTGNDSIIKREIKCTFGKGEDKLAERVRKAIIKIEPSFTDKAFVHPQTLKAFIRENMEEGKEFPMDLFGAFVGNKAVVAPPKK